jgi:hypothetical protein
LHGDRQNRVVVIYCVSSASSVCDARFANGEFTTPIVTKSHCLFTRQDSDKASLKCALEAALLTADEFSSGSAAWKQFVNPFLALEENKQ